MIQGKGVEIILGSKKDPQWGPVILFGGGGQFVEIYKDRALALAPLNHHGALEMMKKTKIFSILQGARGNQSVNIDRLCEIVVAFSHFIANNPSIKECDINPILVTHTECIALDARILLE
jgi:acetyltransferase